MTVARKILLMTYYLCIVVVLFSLVGFHLGYDGLMLVGEMKLPLPVYCIMLYVLFIFQFYMISCIISEEYSWNVFKSVIPFSIAYILLCPFVQTFIMTGIAPFLYLFLFSVFVYKKNIKRTIINILKVYICIASYELFTLIVKTGKFILGYNELSQYQWIVWSIDLIIFLSILYCIGGEKNVVLGMVSTKHWWKSDLCNETVSSPALDEIDLAGIEEVKKFVGFKRIKAVALLLGFQMIQWSIILFVCAIGHVFMEGLVITLSFVAHGFIIRRRWHSNSILVCTLTSASLFYVSAKAIPAFGYTQLLPVIVGVFLLYALYRVALYVDKNKEIKDELNMLKRISIKSFRCNTASEDEMRTRCREQGKSKEYEDFCVMAFVHKIRRNEIASHFNYNESTVKRYITKYKHELEVD